MLKESGGFGEGGEKKEESRNYWEFESKISELEHIDNIVERRLKLLGWSEDEVGFFGLAVHEAVMNAIIHGNAGREKAKVRIDFDLKESEAMITVRDEGGGFDAEKISDPTKEENVFKTSGRGVLLMRQFCDEVKFGPGVVALYKKRQNKQV